MSELPREWLYFIIQITPIVFGVRFLYVLIYAPLAEFMDGLR